MKIIIMGRPASKKNSRRVIMRGGKKFSVPSEAHERFAGDAQVQLTKYHNPFKEPLFRGLIKVKYTFYQKGKMQQDSDNAEGAINDILQAGHIIENDKNIKKWQGEIIADASDWKTEIEIEQL